MVITKELEDKYVFSKEIKFEIDGEEQFVKMREFNMQEMHLMMSAGKVKADGSYEDFQSALEQAEKIFPSCVVDSSLEVPADDRNPDAGTKKASGKQVHDFLKKSNSTFSKILSAWLGKDDDSPLDSARETDKS